MVRSTASLGNGGMMDREEDGITHEVMWMGSIPVWTSSFDSMSLVESGIFGDDWIRQRRRFADRSGDHMASTICGGDPTRASSRRSLDEEGEARGLVPKHVRNLPSSPGPLSATLQPEAGRGSPEDGRQIEKVNRFP